MSTMALSLGGYFTFLTLCSLFGTSVQKSTVGLCPDGWYTFQDTCYLHVHKPYATWDEANKRCADHGAILAEPDTLGKFRFLLQTLEAPGWIGASDRQTEGTWVWRSSGLPLAFNSPWMSGQPDSHFGEEDCLIMGRDGWYDAPCGNWGMPYTCEKQAMAL